MKANFKQLAVAHGEKVALGVVGLLGVVILIGGLTQGTYKNSPNRIIEKAEQAQTDIANSQWPQEKAQQFRAEDRLGMRVAQMLKPVPGDKVRGGFMTGIKPDFELYLREKPLVDPQLLPVRNLIARAFRADFAVRNPLATSIDGSVGPGTGTGTGTGPDAKGDPKKKKLLLGGPGGSGIEGGGPPMGVTPGARGGGADPLGGPAGFKPGAGGVTPMPGAGGIDAGAGTESGYEMASQYIDDGKRVVSVVGIVPLKEQFELFEKAISELQEGSPRSTVGNLIWGFVLERAVSTDGGKTFGDWNEVNLKSAKLYYQTKVADYAAPVVSQRYIHWQVTQPLPLRLLEPYGPEATHPEIKRLSKEDREKQEAAQNAVAKLSKQQQNSGTGEGWGSLQRNIYNDTEQVMNSSSRDFTKEYSKFMQDPMADVGADGAGAGEMNTLRDNILGDVDVLLYRYFDMDVAPGLTYKYRVKLKFRNPLYNQPVEKLALDNVGSAKVEYRFTPFSNETAPVTVPPDTDFFVKSVKDDSLRVPLPSADLHVYQWFTHLGTTADGVVRNVVPGRTVGGEAKADQIDPARMAYDKEAKTKFQTHKLVLDLSSGELDTEHLNNLGLSTKQGQRVNVPDEIVIVDELGRIRRYDQLAQWQRQQAVSAAHDYVKKQTEEAWGNKAKTTDGMGIDAIGMPDDGGYVPEGESKVGRRSRRGGGSALRRGGAQGSAYPPGGAGAYPGGYPPGGKGSNPKGSRRRGGSRRRQIGS